MAFRLISSRVLNKAGHAVMQKRLGYEAYSKLFLINLRHKTVHTVISKNLKLVTRNAAEENKQVMLKTKPLVVMFPWLLARKKHVNKYYDVYLTRGCDILSVSITPWQFFWPLSGSQVVASELVDYLYSSSRQTFLIHGFSIGAYLWGECLVKFNSDPTKYSDLISKIKGQVWDSAADITETSKGLPQAMFPRNAFLRSMIEKYVEYHLRTFYDIATQHYLRASQFYHTTPVRAPCLVFVSNNDPIGSVIANTRAKESWDSMGMKVYWKCWEKSRHVSHFMLHRDEYISSLNTFLNSIEINDETNVKEQASLGV